MSAPEQPKPIPDDPRLRIRVLVGGVIALVIAAVVGAALIASTQQPADFVIEADLPTARLLYTEAGDIDQRYALTLQTGARTLVDGGWSADAPLPSPDGQWLASWQEGSDYYQWHLMIRKAGTREAHRLGTFISASTPPSWSSDSQWILFSALPPDVAPDLNLNLEAASEFDAIESDQMELWMIHVESGELKRLTTNEYMDTNPAMSPDGQHIAYTANASGYHALYVMEAATGSTRLLTPDNNGYSAAWSPDGRWIAFVRLILSEGDYNDDIWIIRADGTGAQAVTNSPAIETYPGWES